MSNMTWHQPHVHIQREWGGKWQRSHCMGHLWCPALLPPHPPVPPADATEIMCSMWGPDSTWPLLSPTCNIPQSKLLACKPSFHSSAFLGTPSQDSCLPAFSPPSVGRSGAFSGAGGSSVVKKPETRCSLVSRLEGGHLHGIKVPDA